MRHLFLLFLFLLASLAPLRARQELSDADYLAELRSDAEQGDAEAQHDLGVVYAKGHGVGQDHVEALRQGPRRWAGSRGGVEMVSQSRRATGGAAVLRGIQSRPGTGISKATFSTPTAHVVAWRSLRDGGDGVVQDPVAARNWYLKAAAQGVAGAQYNLGVLYHDGDYGVVQDYVAARKWYLKAARHRVSSGLNTALAFSTPLATELRRITSRPGNGISKPQRRATSRPDTTLVCSTPRAEVLRRITSRPGNGFSKPPSTATPWPSSALASSTFRASA